MGVKVRRLFTHGGLVAQIDLGSRRQGQTDAMTLKTKTAAASEALREEIAASSRAMTKLGGAVELVSPGALPNDGKVTADER